MQSLSTFSDSSASKADLVLLHANGFPPGTYNSFLSEMSGAGRILTLEHRPLWQAHAPRFLDYSVYADDAIASIQRDAKGPVWLVGHSMGGAISILIAHRAPHLVKGIIALDPVVIRPLFRLWSRIAFFLWPEKPKMVRGALGRPHDFDSYDAAFAFYRSKRAFSAIADKELMDYVLAAHAPSDAGVSLRFSGEWEACVYRSPPNAWGKLKQLQCPIHILGGASSYVITPAVAERLSRIPTVDYHTLDAGHLLPMERPKETAAFVTECIFRYET